MFYENDLKCLKNKLKYIIDEKNRVEIRIDSIKYRIKKKNYLGDYKLNKELEEAKKYRKLLLEEISKLKKKINEIETQKSNDTIKQLKYRL